MAYHQPNLDEIAKLNQQAETENKNKKKAGEFRNLTLENGNNVVIVLPPFNDRGLFVRKVFTHWKLGDGEARFDCVEKSYPEDVSVHCPICRVLKILVDNGIDEATISPYISRAQTYVNVLVQEVGSNEVNFEEYPYLPHILRGPSSLGDFINKAVQERISKGFFIPDNAIPLQIKRIETKKKGRTNIKYEYQWIPERVQIAASQEEIDGILNKTYDLDKIYKKNWDGEIFDSGVALANTLLANMGFAPLDEFPGRPTSVSVNEHAGKKLDTSGSKRTGGPVKKASTSITNEDSESGDSSPVTPTAIATDAKENKESVTLKPAPEVSESSGRDPDRIDPDTNKPFCFGTVDSCDACNSCSFQDACIIITVRKKSGLTGKK